ncbi:MAG: lytic murein transglycosylase [Paracoccaceae bacterium]
MAACVRLGLVLAMLAQPLVADPISRIPRQAVPREDVIVATQAGLQAWIAGFRARALIGGITPQTFDAAMGGVNFLPLVLDRDLHQNEFTKTIWDYLDRAVSDDRIAAGKQALRDHAALLDRIEARYGVDRQIVVAIWGLESAYGQVRGDLSTVDALATLAYASRRSGYFEGQLVAALRILQAGDVTAGAMQGSWAGAMGHTQFMPTSYLDLAVDFDGDGRRDIWGDDPSDALASTAAFLARWGWHKGLPWGTEVVLPGGFDYALAGEMVHKTVANWAALGVKGADGAVLPDGGPASVLLPGGARGAAFLIFPNFLVLEHYNTADAYVIAVGHLGDRILGGPAVQASWPRDLRALTYDERVELQTRLTSAGFNAGGADGRVGPLTIAAIRAFQASVGVVADGFPSLDVLTRLR